MNETNTARAAILCVDDETMILHGLKAQLNRQFGKEYIIEMAETAEEALEIFQEFSESGIEIPLVITDQIMPGMKGNELIREISVRSPKTLHILLTGQADVAAIGDAVNSGSLYRYIPKPWERTDLILTVQEALKSYFQNKLVEEQNRLLREYNEQLEEKVRRRTVELQEEKAKSDALLLNILPEEVADELKEKGKCVPKRYPQVTVLFTDFKGFTKISSDLSPEILIEELNHCFTAFDKIIAQHGLEKIKTIGDAYMCAGGLPVANETHPVDAVRAALALLDWIKSWQAEKRATGGPIWEIRIGINTGELIAGVIGQQKFAFDIWGETVNLASAMESSGETGKVNISENTYSLVKDYFECTPRGKHYAKNVGEVEMYFAESEKQVTSSS